MKITHKKYLGLLLFLSAMLMLFHFSVMVAVDPLQLFHKPWKRDSYFIRELRFQAAGIINNSEFDSVILGTSMAANFSPREASKIWGSKFVNISPDGSSQSERSLILDYALKKKKLKNVIISLDGFPKYGEHKESFPIPNYDYLYDNYRWNDLKIYSNRKYFGYLPCNYSDSYTKDNCKDLKTLETVSEWASNPYHNVRFGGLEYWFYSYQKGQVMEALKKISSDLESLRNGDIDVFDQEQLLKEQRNTRLVFNSYLLKYIKDNPTINFYLYFPPYSRLKNSFIKKLHPTDYEAYLERVRYITNTLDEYKNANVFGFDHLEFTANIANYKDPGHYHPRYNFWMLKWMYGKKFVLNKNNVEGYLKSTSDKTNQYDVTSLGEKVTCFLTGSNSAYNCASR